MESQRLRIIIRGQVQGVGFRPHVYRTANKLDLTGWVQNTAAGVSIEVQGKCATQFITTLKAKLPPLAQITNIETMKISLNTEETSFHIVESTNGKAHTIISPDTSPCADCLTELFDPTSRYYHYPFLNCAHCGPRFTITHDLPYDRFQTSMDCFPLCQDCQIDYSNPNNRRYHAQPTACHKCGPGLTDSLEKIAAAILAGKIIALKGVGGYQLICDAKNESTILELRKRKHREAKPFALMLANTVSIASIVELSADAETLLNDPSRPIVLLKKVIPSSLPQSIAPELSHLGVMLPNSPLHYLLFNALAGSPDGLNWTENFHSSALIVTSANISDSPLIIDDDVACRELKTIADRIISYNRRIITRVDDSVAQVMNGAPFFIRRARGFAPTPIALAQEIPSTLAVGGHLKNTFCITKGNEAFVSQHIGGLTNKETIHFFHESLEHLLKFLNVTPERIAHDLHPDFYSTRFSENYGIPAFPVQHHHAHLLAVAAEHQITEPVLGLVLDGYGYGVDGSARGGELLLLENFTFHQLGSLYPLPQPGGNIVAREPWRMAASVLHLLGNSNEITKRFAHCPQASSIQCLLDKKINTPKSTSCGRLFDAASALLGVCTLSHYEGHAAMSLESLVTSPQIISDGWKIVDGALDMRPTLNFLLEVTDPVIGANLFHGTLIAALGAWIKEAVQETGVNVVLLGGGCFLNKVLTEGLIEKLTELGIQSILPRALPPNDGGISLGQAWFAGRM